MSYGFRGLLLSLLCCLALVGCGGSSSGGDDAPLIDQPVPPTPNALVTTASMSHVAAKVNGGSQVVSFTFTSDDGQPIKNLSVNGLTTLPSGWSGVSTFACGTVTIGNSCMLSLTYAPTVVINDRLLLSYRYDTSAGNTVTGEFWVTYSGTTDNNVTATVNPAGQVVAIVGQTTSVSVSFNTDDQNAASALQLTTDLSALPGNWSAVQNTLPCTYVGSGQDCEITLEYSPVAVGSGTLVLNYEFVDNSGTTKTANVNIPYTATASNNVVANASRTQIETRIGGSKQATVTFTTDDGNLATDLQITSTLPTDWSVGGSTCASVSTGNGCAITLTYAPLAVASGTLNLDYSYLDNSGQAKTGSLNVAYTGRNLRAYVAGDLGVYYCALDSSGALDNCQTTTAPLMLARGIVFHDGEAYVSNFASGDIERCAVGTGGDLVSCQTFATGLSMSGQLAATDSHLYVISRYPSTDRTSVCSFADGSCVTTGSTTSPNGIALNGQIAYISVGGGTGTVQTCAIQSNGDLSSCFFNAAFSDPVGMAVANGFVYVADQGNDTIAKCTAALNGGLSACTTTPIAGPTDIEIVGDRAYITQQIGASMCAVANDGSLQNCITSTGGASFFSPLQVTVD